MKNLIFVFIVLIGFSCSRKGDKRILEDLHNNNKKAIETLQSEFDNLKRNYESYHIKYPQGYYKNKLLFDEYDRLYIHTKGLISSNIELIKNNNNKLAAFLGLPNNEITSRNDSITMNIKNILLIQDSCLTENDSIFKQLYLIERISQKLTDKHDLKNIIYLQMIQKRLIIFMWDYINDFFNQANHQEDFTTEVFVIAYKTGFKLGDTVELEVLPAYCLKNQNLKYKINGVDDTNIDSLGNFKFKASQTGFIRNKYEIIKTNPRTGDTLIYSDRMKYYVY